MVKVNFISQKNNNVYYEVILTIEEKETFITGTSPENLFNPEKMMKKAIENELKDYS